MLALVLASAVRLLGALGGGGGWGGLSAPLAGAVTATVLLAAVLPGPNKHSWPKIKAIFDFHGHLSKKFAAA